MSEASVVALVPVAGRVDRSAALTRVADVPLLVHAVRHLVASGVVDRIVVLLPSDVDDSSYAALTDAGLVAAGTVRVVSDSITGSSTTRVLADEPAARVVLVHDPLRAFAPVDLIRRVVHAVVTTDTPVVPVLPCSDTVKRLDADGVILDTPDRTGLRVLQTPLGYPAALLRSGAVVAGVVPPGARTVPGDPAARRLAGAVALATVDGGVA
jgi:2-C-methyl-D-erythritol 4-phosphate cytidylyltransferase